MELTSIDWSQVGAGVIGLGVVVKGIKDYVAKSKAGTIKVCQYNDDKLDTIIALLTAHAGQSTETHDWTLVIKTMMEAKK